MDQAPRDTPSNDQNSTDYTLRVPDEMLIAIFSHLETPRNLIRVAQTCRRWRSLADDSSLWKKMCLKEEIAQDSQEKSPESWKALYKQQHSIHMNWTVNPVSGLKTQFKGDHAELRCFKLMDNNKVVTSSGNVLKIWSTLTGECLRTLTGHTSRVNCLATSGSTIVSGDHDHVIKVWNADSGECTHELLGHTSAVRLLQVGMGKILSLSNDPSLRLWDLHTGECLGVLEGHTISISCVMFDGRRVVSGDRRGLIKIWNPDCAHCEYTVVTHGEPIRSLQFNETYGVALSSKAFIYIWDIETGQHRTTIYNEPFAFGISKSLMVLRGHTLIALVCGYVHAWELSPVDILHAHLGELIHRRIDIKCNKKYILTSTGNDGTVELWDYNAARFIRTLFRSNGYVEFEANETQLICVSFSNRRTDFVVFNMNKEI